MPQGLPGTSSSSHSFDCLSPVEVGRSAEDFQTWALRIHSRQVTTYRLHRSGVHEYNDLHCAARPGHWRPEIRLEPPRHRHIRLRCCYRRWNVCRIRTVLRERANLSCPTTHPLRCWHFLWNPSPAELFSDRSKTQQLWLKDDRLTQWQANVHHPHLLPGHQQCIDWRSRRLPHTLCGWKYSRWPPDGGMDQAVRSFVHVSGMAS